MTANASPPVAIAVAPNGGRRTKADHPAIPFSPAELARTAADCCHAGAAMIHVHVRKADGAHLLDADAYRAAIGAIRQAVGDGLVIQMTTEALGLYSPAEQRAVVREVRPEAVSLALRELVPSSGEEVAFAELLDWLKQESIAPQIILYSPDEAMRLADFIRRGLVPWSDLPVLFVLGRYSAGQTSTPPDLLPFVDPRIPRFAHWSVCAFGKLEATCVGAAALLGGHTRVGFENNLWLPTGDTAPSNAALVDATRSVLASLGLVVATADRLREDWRHVLE